MRTFKSLWRLALDKGFGRNARRKPARQAAAKDTSPRDCQENIARLLGDDPPTRTLQ